MQLTCLLGVRIGVNKNPKSNPKPCNCGAAGFWAAYTKGYFVSLRKGVKRQCKRLVGSGGYLCAATNGAKMLCMRCTPLAYLYAATNAATMLQTRSALLAYLYAAPHAATVSSMRFTLVAYLYAATNAATILLIRSTLLASSSCSCLWLLVRRRRSSS